MKSRQVAVGVVALTLLAGAAAVAQPQQQHLVQAGNIVYLGKFSLPQGDGTSRSTAEGSFLWGGSAIGIGPDGQSLYFGCQDAGNRIARVTIPALGGTSSVVEPCAAIANLGGINPSDPNSKRLGGSLWWNGRLTVSAYSYYDGNSSAVASHFVGTTVANQAGPHRVGSLNPGFVGGYMGVVPQEWRGLLGGPALTGQCCLSILSRTSYGPSVSVFNPDQLGTVSPVPSTMLVGYPDAHQTFGPWNVSNPYFTGATTIGGVAFPAGTRSVLFIGRHSSTFCYGTGTSTQALHGTPDGQGNVYCYDPGNNAKGTHGYPYKHQIWAYDANDLLAVKQGTKNPWDVRPYAVWTLTQMNNTGGSTVRSATYDPASRRVFITEERGDAQPLVHVFEITNAVLAAPPPPPPPAPVPEVCGDGIDNDLDGLVDEGCVVVPPPVEVCGDGIDNDKDGIVDEGCVEATPEKCGDLIDNDQDGLIDEGCAPVVVEVCGDAKDNDGDGLIDEGCATAIAAPGAVRRLYSSVSRSNVSFKWYPPITGGAVTDYVLEAGVAPGTTFFSAPVTSTSLYVPNVGTGRYYVRVKARNANGTGKASNEVTVSVGCYTRPRQVSGLRATSSGGVVTLTWTDPDGCSGTSYEVTVADSITASSRQMSTDTPEATTLLTAGSYTARVRTLSDAGLSEPTTLQFTVDDNVCPTPRLHLGLRSVVAGRRVGLFWSPLDPDVAAADDSVALVNYAIEAGTAPGAADIGVVPMGRAAQFITDVPPGTYYVRVRSGNACGGGKASNEVKLVVR